MLFVCLDDKSLAAPADFAVVGPYASVRPLEDEGSGEYGLRYELEGFVDIVVADIYGLIVAYHRDITLAQNLFMVGITSRVGIAGKEGVLARTLYRLVGLHPPYIRVHDEGPSQFARPAVYQLGESIGRVEGLPQPFFFARKQVCVVSSVSPPGTPAVG